MDQFSNCDPSALARALHVGRALPSIVHEMNNRLGSALTYAELMEMDDSWTDETRRMLSEMAATMASGSDTLNRLARLLEPPPGVCRSIPVFTLLKETHNLFKRPIRSLDIDWQTRGNSDVPVWFDELALQQIGLYLLDNAIDAVRDCTVRAVEIAVEQRADSVQVRIQNSGQPISDAQSRRIFEPFYSTKGGDHPGLGLFEARRLAEQFGGSLRYDPSNGFELSLPCGDAQERR